MPGRQYTGATGYRYGFGTQEKDDEIYGAGNSYTAEYWQYDSRLGRRWNLDPIDKPWQSNYATYSDNPILNVDIKGDTDGEYIKNKDGTLTQVSTKGDAEGVDYIYEGDWVTAEGDRKGGFEATNTEVVDQLKGGKNAISSNYNCHGTPTNRDILNSYYKDVDIQHGQLLQSRFRGSDLLFGLREADNGTLVNYTGYPANYQEIAMHNQAEADIASLSTIEGRGGYSSFRAFKRANGSAGKGKAWHHIVEQNPSNIAKFGPKKIHHLDNLIKVEHGAASVHSRVSAFYSSKQPFTNGKTVREWLKDKDYAEQYEFGLEVLEQFNR